MMYTFYSTHLNKPALSLLKSDKLNVFLTLKSDNPRIIFFNRLFVL